MNVHEPSLQLTDGVSAEQNSSGKNVVHIGAESTPPIDRVSFGEFRGIHEKDLCRQFRIQHD
jgi:hypothetical protein